MTEDEVRHMLRDVAGRSVAAWARNNGFTQSWVSKVLRGEQAVTERLANSLGLTRKVSFGPCHPEKAGAQG